MQRSGIADEIGKNLVPGRVSQALKTGDDNKVAAAMAELPVADRDRCRAEVAKRLGVRRPILDKMVAGQVRKDSEATQGRAAAVEQLEPWPQPVSGAELATEMAATVTRFAVLPPGAATAIALWVLHAWAFTAFGLSPILAFIAPTKRSGKSNALFVTSFMCPRRVITTNLTDAAAFRLIEHDQPTLIVDEVDKLIRRDSNAIDTLINGYIKESAVVIRCTGDDHEVRTFSAWTPKVIALIGKLRPDTLHDRCIVVAMQPKLRHEQVERRRDAKLPGELLPLRQKALRWATDNSEALRDSEPDLPDELHDRAQDNWEPLFAIANLLGKEWPAKARKTAIVLSPLDADTERLPVRLLDAIRADVIPGHPYDVIAGKEIEEKLLEESDSQWHEMNRGKPVTATKVARLLKPFELAPRTHHDSSRRKSIRGYRLTDFEPVIERYLGFIDHTAPRQSVRASGTQSRRGETAASKCKVANSPLTPLEGETAPETGQSDTLTLPEGGCVGGKDEIKPCVRLLGLVVVDDNIGHRIDLDETGNDERGSRGVSTGSKPAIRAMANYSWQYCRNGSGDRGRNSDRAAKPLSTT